MIFTLEATITTDGKPQSFTAQSWYLSSLAEAEAYAATFPKSLRMRAVDCCTRDGHVYYVRMSASLAPNLSTGAVNETSQRRVRAFYRAADKMDIQLTWATPYGNSYATEEEFQQAAL